MTFVSGNKPRTELEIRGAKVLWSLGKRSASLRRSQGNSTGATGSPAESEDTPTTRQEGAPPKGGDNSQETGDDY